jgi:hypothetical protein
MAPRSKGITAKSPKKLEITSLSCKQVWTGKLGKKGALNEDSWIKVPVESPQSHVIKSAMMKQTTPKRFSLQLLLSLLKLNLEREYSISRGLART